MAYFSGLWPRLRVSMDLTAFLQEFFTTNGTRIESVVRDSTNDDNGEQQKDEIYI
jgi:hypothetical protein